MSYYLVLNVRVLRYSILIAYLFSLTIMLQAQDRITPPIDEKNTAIIWQDEPIYRRSLKAKGISDAVINKLVEEKVAIMKSGRKIKWAAPKIVDNNRPGAPCSGMGVEGGWGAWQAQTGDYEDAGDNVPSTLTVGTLGAPLAPRFNITSGAGIDPCTPAAAAGSPTIPVVAPGFGTASIQLGIREQNGNQGGCATGCAEQIIYALDVTAQDTNFLYAFAYVLENPSIHDTGDQPYIEFKILDSTGDTLDCSYQRYFGNSTTPGLFNATCLPPGVPLGDVVYKPWSIVGVNLKKYIGQVVTIVITNVDCSQGGHFAHSYWDFSCGVLSTNPASYCLGNSVSITAPSNPTVVYSYQWYLNHKPFAPNGTSQTIVPYPQVGDTFMVEVKQPSGCGFKIVYVPQPLTVGSNFTSITSCTAINFADSAIIFPGVTVNGWDWTFQNGTPGTFSGQTPPPITFPVGTHSVTLITSSQDGCKDTVVKVVTMGGLPHAAIASPPACLGLSTQFVNTSAPFSNADPITSWQWNFGDGSISNVQYPIHTYTNSGTYTYTLLITTTAGCVDTATNRVTIYGLPVASYTDSAKGCAPLTATFKDLSAATDGTIVLWNWSFPGGSPGQSTVANPTVTWNNPGTYDVNLIVENSHGCKDTLAKPMYIHVYPWPKADFSIAPDVAPTESPIFNFSDLWSKDVIRWKWDFGDGSPKDSIQTDPKHSYAAVAPDNDFYSFNVCLNVQNQYGCWDKICRPLDILPEFEFYIPNCITVNGDGKNEFFFGKSRGVKEYQIWVFDRWGNLLWDCGMKGKNTDYDKPTQDGMSSACKWDGKTERGAGSADMNGNSGNLSQEDVYVWKVKLLDIFDKKHTYVGHVSIVQ